MADARGKLHAQLYVLKLNKHQSLFKDVLHVGF